MVELICRLAQCEDSYGHEVTVVVVDDELDVVLDATNVAMELVMCGVYGCLGVELLLCSHECCPREASINVEVLLGMWGPLKSSYLVFYIGEDVAILRGRYHKEHNKLLRSSNTTSHRT